MITRCKRYEHAMGGQYNETVGTLEDGRRVEINTQYAAVLPVGAHAATCDQINRMGGRCTCGMLDGIDVAAVLADARANGKFGAPPVAPRPERVVTRSRRDDNVCPKCGTVCYGDCDAR